MENDDKEALAHPIQVDGHSLTLGDIFPDAYRAREFRTKLKLLNSKSSGEDDGLDPEMEKEIKTKEDLEDVLFKPKKKKDPQEKNPVGMDGE